MARETIRGPAYALHAFLAIVAAAVPLLGFLQDARIVPHGFAEGSGMMIVLWLGLPALVLVPVALTLSILTRPWDPALLLLSGVLLLVIAAACMDFRDLAFGIIMGAYVLGSMGLGLRWLVSHWKHRQT
jgi:hypothetical protein